MAIEIRLVDVWKSFGENEVLRGVTLTLRSGEISVIIGGSGSGKSVTLKHILGLIRPDRGQVYVDGREITQLREVELYPIRRRMGMIFQNAGLLQSLSVGQNVGLALSEFRLAPPWEIERIVEEKLALVGLAGKSRERPTNLSGGMRKRAAIARALTLNADCLLYDEPTAGLDPPMSETIDSLILDMKRKTGCTSVVVTHDLASVFRVADSIHMLHQGRIIFSGRPAELLAWEDPRAREFLARGLRPGGGFAPLAGAAPRPAAAADRATEKEA